MVQRALALVVLSVSVSVSACGPSATGDQDGDDGQGPEALPCADGRCENHCPDGTRTTISGRVLAPNGVDPIPFAQVYLPAEVAPLPEGASCELCSELAGNALIQVTTDVDGSFELGPVPTAEAQAPGVEVDLVVQKGRFRKVGKLAIDAPCADNPAPEAVTRLPARSDGLDTIPKIAVATGAYDVMECVLLDLGLEQGSFDLYNGIAGGLSPATPNTLGDLDVLLRDGARMKQYNVIFINCSANEFETELQDEAVRRNLEDYVAAGGRLYVTDWSYDYVEQIPEWSPVIDFAPGASGGDPEPLNDAAVGTGGIELQGKVQDGGLASWLHAVERVTGEEIISDADTVHLEHFLFSWVQQREVPAAETSKVWLDASVDGAVRPLTTTFDYLSCGRVLYSSYHTLGRDAFASPTFPLYCSAEAASPQERVLLFLILHVADCIGDVE